MTTMTWRRWIVPCAVLALGAVALTVRAQDDPEGKRREFMRQKLEFSKGLIEGLAMEDFTLIEKNAKALKKLASAAEWEVPSIPHVEEYLPLTTEFQRHCDDLIKKAKAKNVDGATLAYFQVTASCVKCHKFVRDADQPK